MRRRRRAVARDWLYSSEGENKGDEEEKKGYDEEEEVAEERGEMGNSK